MAAEKDDHSKERSEKAKKSPEGAKEKKESNEERIDRLSAQVVGINAELAELIAKQLEENAQLQNGGATVISAPKTDWEAPEFADYIKSKRTEGAEGRLNNEPYNTESLGDKASFMGQEERVKAMGTDRLHEEVDKLIDERNAVDPGSPEGRIKIDQLRDEINIYMDELDSRGRAENSKESDPLLKTLKNAEDKISVGSNRFKEAISELEEAVITGERPRQSLQDIGEIISENENNFKAKEYKELLSHIDSLTNIRKSARPTFENPKEGEGEAEDDPLEALAKKIASGATDFSEEELILQQTEPQKLEEILARLKEESGKEDAEEGESDDTGTESETLPENIDPEAYKNAIEYLYYNLKTSVDKSDLASALGLNDEQAKEMIDFLEERGILQKTKVEVKPKDQDNPVEVLAAKMANGATDFSAEELELQQKESEKIDSILTRHGALAHEVNIEALSRAYEPYNPNHNERKPGKADPEDIKRALDYLASNPDIDRVGGDFFADEFREGDRTTKDEYGRFNDVADYLTAKGVLLGAGGVSRIDKGKLSEIIDEEINHSPNRTNEAGNKINHAAAMRESMDDYVAKQKEQSRVRRLFTRVNDLRDNSDDQEANEVKEPFRMDQKQTKDDGPKVDHAVAMRESMDNYTAKEGPSRIRNLFTRVNDLPKDSNGNTNRVDGIFRMDQRQVGSEGSKVDNAAAMRESMQGISTEQGEGSVADTSDISDDSGEGTVTEASSGEGISSYTTNKPKGRPGLLRRLFTRVNNLEER